MIRKLAYFGNSSLRKKCEEVAEITDEIKTLVQDLIDTMHGKDGIGLAAPQICVPLRIFVTYVPQPSEDDPDRWVEGVEKVYINPVLSEPSEEKWTRDEGCLSIPKVYGSVQRPYRISVEATDLHGNRFKEELSGLDARCVMHENDHINGVLFIDRMSKFERKKIEKQLKRIKEELGKPER